MTLYTYNIVEAMALAIEVHKEQVDKAGKPYISHIMRVAEKMNTEEEIIVALLHDVIEDAKGNYHNIIKEKFGEYIYDTLIVLTHSKDEPYEEYINRIHDKGGIAASVKMSDLEDNMNSDRTLKTISYLLEKGNDATVIKMLKKRDLYTKAYNLLKCK